LIQKEFDSRSPFSGRAKFNFLEIAFVSTWEIKNEVSCKLSVTVVNKWFEFDFLYFKSNLNLKGIR
jgi:hypothetical protein